MTKVDPLTVPGWAERTLDAAHGAMITHDADGTIVHVNGATEALTGHDRGELLGRPASMLMPSLARPTKASATPETVVPTNLRHRDGHDVPVDIQVVATSTEPRLVTAYLHDRTDRLGLQRRLAAIQSNREQIEEQASIGTWEVDLISGKVTWSSGVYRLMGLDAADFEPTLDNSMDRIHSEDREGMAGDMERILERPEQFVGHSGQIAFRTVHPDGTVREVVTRWTVEADEHGQPTRWVGTGHDVTELHHSQTTIAALDAVVGSVRQWQSAEHGLSDLVAALGEALAVPQGAIWTMDPESGYLRCRAFWTTYGDEAGDFERLTRRARLRPGEGLAGRAWATDRAVLTDRLPEEIPLEGRSAARSLGVWWALGFAATGASGPIAALTFYSHRQMAYDENFLASLENVGRGLGRFLDARRGELAPPPLTDREMQVLTLAAEGNAGPEIARQLALSTTTVKTHFENLYEKLGVKDRAAAVAQGFRLGLLH